MPLYEWFSFQLITSFIILKALGAEVGEEEGAAGVGFNVSPTKSVVGCKASCKSLDRAVGKGGAAYAPESLGPTDGATVGAVGGRVGAGVAITRSSGKKSILPCARACSHVRVCSRFNKFMLGKFCVHDAQVP